MFVPGHLKSGQTDKMMNQRMIAERSNPNPPFTPYFALVSGVLAVSTGAIFARLAEAPALVIAAYRLGIAVLILAPITVWKARG